MKILIADKFHADGIVALESVGCEVAFEPATSAEQLEDVIRKYQPNVLVVRSTKVSAEAIRSGEQLSLIVRAGAGYDTIDVAEASSRGVYVANCPGKNSNAVAELAWGLILSCDRRIPDQTADLRTGRWNKKEYSNASGLMGRTLGVIGTGRIGMAIARSGMAFGMNVIGWSRSLTEEKAQQLGIGFCDSLQTLAAQSDVVSVSVAATAETNKLIDAKFLSNLKQGAYLVNTSRGSVVDQEALELVIKEKGVRAGLDVYSNEPGSGVAEFSPEIVNLPGVYGTHHVGASTRQAQEAIAAEAVRVILTYRESGDVENCVNLASQTPATTQLAVRHINRPGVLAHVFQVFGDARINVEEMQNVIYDGAHAAVALIQIGGDLNSSQLDAISQNENILSVETRKIM
jgi:D-3-phosphoglycerate dehydrogenase